MASFFVLLVRAVRLRDRRTAEDNMENTNHIDFRFFKHPPETVASFAAVIHAGAAVDGLRLATPNGTATLEIAVHQRHHGAMRLACLIRGNWKAEARRYELRVLDAAGRACLVSESEG